MNLIWAPGTEHYQRFVEASRAMGEAGLEYDERAGWIDPTRRCICGHLRVEHFTLGCYPGWNSYCPCMDFNRTEQEEKEVR